MSGAPDGRAANPRRPFRRPARPRLRAPLRRGRQRGWQPPAGPLPRRRTPLTARSCFCWTLSRPGRTCTAKRFPSSPPPTCGRWRWAGWAVGAATSPPVRDDSTYQAHINWTWAAIEEVGLDAITVVDPDRGGPARPAPGRRAPRPLRRRGRRQHLPAHRGPPAQ